MLRTFEISINPIPGVTKCDAQGVSPYHTTEKLVAQSLPLATIFGEENKRRFIFHQKSINQVVRDPRLIRGRFCKYRRSKHLKSFRLGVSPHNRAVSR